MHDHLTVPYIAYESMMVSDERKHRRLTTIIIIQAVIILALIIGVFVYLSLYDFTGYSQDGDGVNNIVDGAGNRNEVNYDGTENAETHFEESLPSEGQSSP